MVGNLAHNQGQEKDHEYCISHDHVEDVLVDALSRKVFGETIEVEEQQR